MGEEFAELEAGLHGYSRFEEQLPRVIQAWFTAKAHLETFHQEITEFDAQR